MQPGEWHKKQRREYETQKRVDPDQRDVETAKAETSPKDAERSVSFQARRSCDRDLAEWRRAR